jgi:hypothetical protein
MYKGFIACSVRTILFMLIEAIKDDCRCCQWVGSSDSAAVATSPGWIRRGRGVGVRVDNPTIMMYSPSNMQLQH